MKNLPRSPLEGDTGYPLYKVYRGRVPSQGYHHLPHDCRDTTSTWYKILVRKDPLRKDHCSLNIVPKTEATQTGIGIYMVYLMLSHYLQLGTLDGKWLAGKHLYIKHLANSFFETIILIFEIGKEQPVLENPPYKSGVGHQPKPGR